MPRLPVGLLVLFLFPACADSPVDVRPDPMDLHSPSLALVAQPGEDLGSLPGGTTSEAMALNGNGVIVGYGQTPDGQTGFRWADASGFETLPASYAPSALYAIGDDDRGAGTVTDAGFGRAAVLGSDGVVTLLPAASGNPLDAARTMNTTGQLAGSARWLVSTGPSVYQVHATRWAGTAAAAERIVVPGAVASDGLAMNDGGEVAGYWTDGTGATRAFYADATGAVVEIDRPSGYSLAVATSINQAGTVVGYLREGGDTRGFRWTVAGGLELLPYASAFTYALPYAISSEGRIAGSIRDAAGAFHAAVLVDGAWLDLEEGSTSNSVARAIAGDVVIGSRAGVAARWSLAPSNTAPTVTAIALPADPVPVGEPATTTITYDDPDAGDSHTVAIHWGDGAISIAPGAGSSATASHAYAAAGVYTVVVEVTDAAGETGSRSSSQDTPSYLVIFDTSAGHVTGGGWINSPADACPSLCGGASGKAAFGFTARYQELATAPGGETQFRLNAGDFRFHSTSHVWLTVEAGIGRFEGVGEVNGGGDYRLVVTAVDGQATGGEDRFRIRVTEHATGAVVYDNQPGAPEISDAGTALGGGNIAVHAK